MAETSFLSKSHCFSNLPPCFWNARPFLSLSLSSLHLPTMGQSARRPGPGPWDRGIQGTPAWSPALCAEQWPVCPALGDEDTPGPSGQRSRGAGWVLPAGRVYGSLAPEKRWGWGAGAGGTCRESHRSVGSWAGRAGRRPDKAGGDRGRPWAKPGVCSLPGLSPGPVTEPGGDTEEWKGGRGGGCTGDGERRGGNPLPSDP